MFFLSVQGRTFSSLIQSLLEKAGPLNDEYLPLWSGVPGRRVYEDTLAACKEAYPQYVSELQGTADGAGVAFHKVSPSFILTLFNYVNRSSIWETS